MANRNTQGKRTSTAVIIAPKINEPSIKAVSLRLPEKLSDLAQQCAQASGLSLNGLICSALADYLSFRGYQVHSVENAQKRPK